MIKRNIPNAITLGNLFCGCLAIVKCFEGDLVWAAYLVGIAAVLDFFDGFAARILKVTSPIGKDLDSLADMVTFGVVPGVMMFKLFKITIPIQNWEGCVGCEMPGHYLTPSVLESYLPYLALLIPIFSAIRLAKFNNDTRQTESFIGLPTPANAILICSLPLIIYFSSGIDGSIYPTRASMIINQYGFLTSLTLITSLLLIAPIPLFALKFKNFKWRGNEIRFVFLIWSLLSLVFLQFIGIPFIIISYILFSLINNLFLKKEKNA